MTEDPQNTNDYPDQRLLQLRLEAQHYATSDPEAALFKSRLAAEHICIELIRPENPKFIRSTSLTLGDLIPEVKRSNLASPGAFIKHLQAIQNYGNWGVHTTTDGKAKASTDAVTCVQALEILCQEYSKNYFNLELPDPPITSYKHKKEKMESSPVSPTPTRTPSSVMANPR